MDSGYLKRTGVNKEFDEQRVGLLPNFFKLKRVDANGFDYLSNASIVNAVTAGVLLEVSTLDVDMCGHIRNSVRHCPLIA